MGILLGGAALLLAVAALHRLSVSSQTHDVIEGLLRRALPGARTGGSEEGSTPDAGTADTNGRFRWAQVVNLTAADVANRPRPTPAHRGQTKRTPVEQR